MRKIDYVIIVLDVIAAMLTAIGSPFGSPFFVFASVIGVMDGIKHKATSATIINCVFLALNTYCTFKTFVLPLI